MFGWIWSPPPLVILTCHLAPDLPHMAREKRHTWLGPSDQAGCWGKSGQEWWWVGAGLGRGIWSRPPCEPWPEHCCCCCCPMLHHHPHHPLALLPHLGIHNADHLLAKTQYNDHKCTVNLVYCTPDTYQQCGT